ncbi:MAG TPA: hypothetical protein VHE35_35085 [Kofleriaceae bacterium]|nr:hypothetical protein [Kofleriaceae bacterium]
MVESRRDTAPPQPAPDAGARALTADERRYAADARAKAFVLYEGVQVRHRSCGIAIAETFGVPTAPYQALRRGGITGTGTCGALRAGEQLLGELLGDPDPAGAVTPALRAAITWYQEAAARVDRGGAPDTVCNNLVRPHGDFAGPRRKAFCTSLAAQVAELAAEALLRFAPEVAAAHPIAPVVPERGPEETS